MIKEHKLVLEKLCKIIEEEQCCAKVIAPTNNEIQSDLETVKKTFDDKFFVLIMGIFSSGKSSMINALIGESLLPTGFLPETAVLGEMHYGKEKKITMYPKKGMWHGGDEPFDLQNPTTEELAKYASIDNEAGINGMKEGSTRVIEAKFEKMVIHWPLEILKDGVVLVDSPGINDPWNNDYITKGYLPKVDAIIYLMNSQQAYSKIDKDQLEEINDMNIRDIMVGYTFFDAVSQGDPNSVGKIKRVLNAHAEEHTDLGKEAVHYLSSLDGLKAKLTSDQDLLVTSGYYGLEKYLEKYLVENKGVAQVKGMSNKIKHYATMLKKEAETRNKAASGDMETAKVRIALAQDKIKTIKRDADSVIHAFELDVKDGKKVLHDKIDGFVPNLADSVDLEGFEPEARLPKGFGKLNPIAQKKKAKEIQEECVEEFTRRLQKAQTKWVSNTLFKDLVSIEEKCIENNAEGLVELSNKLNDVDLILTEGVVKGAGNGTAANLVGSAIYTLFTGDWFTGAMGAVYGKGTIVKRIGFQSAAAGILLAVGAPITLPVVAIAAIVADIVMLLSTNQTKQTGKILKTVVKHSREGYAKDAAGQEKNADALKKNVDTHLDDLYNRTKAAVESDIKQKETLIQLTLTDAQKDEDEKAAQVKARKEACQKLDELVAEAEIVIADYNT